VLSLRMVYNVAKTGRRAGDECMKDLVITQYRNVLKPNKTVADISALTLRLPLKALAHLDTPTKTARDAVGLSRETHGIRVHIVALCASQTPQRCKSTCSRLPERAWLHTHQANKLIVLSLLT